MGYINGSKPIKGTALNHITINGVDKLLSNGSTEVGLNGVNIIEETVMVHGDILRWVFHICQLNI